MKFLIRKLGPKTSASSSNPIVIRPVKNDRQCRKTIVFNIKNKLERNVRQNIHPLPPPPRRKLN